MSVGLWLTAHTMGCALLIGGVAAGGAAGAAASAKDADAAKEPDAKQEPAVSPMTYVGTVLVNGVYVPAKVVFAGAGMLTSGVTYLVTLGNASDADAVWNASVNGTYVITPRMLVGHDPVQFVGTA